MRALLLTLSLLLAGCASEAPDQVEGPAATPEVAQDPEAGVVEATAVPALLSVLECDMPDVFVHVNAGVRGATNTGCDFSTLDIPDGARSMRLNFTYAVAAAPSDYGIHLSDPSHCDFVTGGDGCSLASARGPSPVFVDVPSDVLDGRDLAALDAAVIGYGSGGAFTLQIEFYSTDAPA